jgi:TctA family transporter
MLEALGQGVALLLQPMPFLFLLGGTVIGMVVGVIPGMGGLTTMTVLLPIVWGLPPIYALPLLTALLAVTATSDSIPAIMFGAPSDASASASVMEGYSMARNGEAARALGAAFSASMMGGIFGAVALAVSIPIARPLLNQFLSPEFFMLCVLGITLVGGMTGKSPFKGLAMGAFGLLLSTIGGAPGVGHYRYTFDLPYLFSGLPLICVAMGLMALPEIADLFIKSTQISNVTRPQTGKGVWRGWKDTFSEMPLVIKSSVIGAWIGFAPGIGGSAASWMAYSYAATTKRGKPKLDKDGKVLDGYSGQFGTGDVRGIIAPESSNNAVKGGDLIPTLLFGIPGSGAMAIFLSAMLIIGIRPGPAMLDPHGNLPLTFSIMWSLCIANILATIVCSGMSRIIGRVSLIDIHYVIPVVLLFMVYGVWQATTNWGDLIVLAVMGGIGWTMKRLGWPRPPVLIGFVLGGLADKYLWLSVSIFDLDWLLRPWVLGIMAVTMLSLWWIVRSQTHPKPALAGVPAGADDEEEE